MPKDCNVGSEINTESPTAYPLPPFTTPTLLIPLPSTTILTKAPNPFPVPLLRGMFSYVPAGVAG